MADTAPGRPSAIAVWGLGVRPKTLSIAVTPVIVGSAVAYAETGQLNGTIAAAALIGGLLIQSGTNLHNDAADFHRGADTPERTGPRRITAQGWASARQVAMASYICFALSTLIGLYLIWVGGWAIAVLGLLSILAGLAYTGGPRPIAYTPLGELFVFLFFGLGAVIGSHYLQTLDTSWSALVAGIAIGLPAAAVLSANNYRDLDNDRQVGKKTFAVTFGRPATRILYIILILAPHTTAPLFADLGPWTLLPLSTIPWGIFLCQRFLSEAPGPGFNAILALTALYQAAFGVLLALGLVLG
ncbi:MAG: 1,4-dihydroxy-2-naphthoate polyprenyltransferase [Rhodospirillales bacterium]|nr:1,4-dihydroxy-2-naphthoate polyprenyltransferase [Rhodospirillales bacterium]